MSFVSAVPESLGASARDVVGIGMTITNSNAIAAGPTVAVSAAAGDQVSAAVAAFFSGHARGYQTLSAQAAEIHNQFAQKLGADANTYAAAEAANAAPMQQLLDGTNTATPAGSPATGNGGNTPGSGANGLLRGNGNSGGPGSTQQRLGGSAGGKLDMGMVGGNSSAGISESVGNERFGGLLLGNNGAGSATRLGNSTGAEPSRVGGLLSKLSRAGQLGGGTSGDAAQPGPILLRLVEDEQGSETTSRDVEDKLGAGEPAETTLAGRVGSTDHKKGWLFSSRSVGGSGGQLSRPAVDTEIDRDSVTSAAGGNGGWSLAAGASPRDAAGSAVR